MKNTLEEQVSTAIKGLYGIDAKAELSRPEEQFGDYATNVALRLAKSVGKNPREIAEALSVKLRETLSDQITEISMAGPGFINIKLSDQVLLESLNQAPAKSLEGQTVVAEYSDPNPFKILHAGHLYTTIVGDAIARLMEKAGATVHRVNFGGDVGLHVGKTMWAIVKELGGYNYEKLKLIPSQERLSWLSQRYVVGNKAYEEDEAAKDAIMDVNKRVYDLHSGNDHESDFARIYWTCRQWSYEGFDKLYKQLEIVPFDKYYPESEVAELGFKTVKEHVGSVYEESNGAIIFRGEEYGLFTQVFITSEGLPTYAGKDVGLIFHKHNDFKPDQSFIITDHAQKDHLAVVMKSISLYAPELVQSTTHYTHGQIKMIGGIKMSSRMGNILSAGDILATALAALEETGREPKDATYLGAVKYEFLKNRIGGDIIYDPQESVSLEGNSGPYLQYAHARARSILSKAVSGSEGDLSDGLQAGERSLVRKISEYTEVVEKATNELMPHYIATYLYELAQAFNRFYEHNRVIGDERESIRLGLVNKYAATLKEGLNLLGIAAPDRM
jgi:arginyl-tRNA synthetase